MCYFSDMQSFLTKCSRCFVALLLERECKALYLETNRLLSYGVIVSGEADIVRRGEDLPMNRRTIIYPKLYVI